MLRYKTTQLLMLELPVWRAKHGMTNFFILPLYSTSQKNLLLGKWHGSLNYRQEKCWHFLFGGQNGRWQHFVLHQCIRHPEKDPFCNILPVLIIHSTVWRFCVLLFYSTAFSPYQPNFLPYFHPDPLILVRYCPDNFQLHRYQRCS